MKKNKNSTAYKFRIGSNIRKWRNIKDIKQKDLATALQVSEAAISNIENDVTNITLGQLEEIAIAINVSIEQLLSDPQEKFRGIPPPAQAIYEKEQRLIDKEFLNAMITSMEKKDQQLQLMMQHFLHVMTTLLQQEKMILNGSKQVSSQA